MGLSDASILGAGFFRAYSTSNHADTLWPRLEITSRLSRRHSRLFHSPRVFGLPARKMVLHWAALQFILIYFPYGYYNARCKSVGGLPRRERSLPHFQGEDGPAPSQGPLRPSGGYVSCRHHDDLSFFDVPHPVQHLGWFVEDVHYRLHVGGHGSRNPLCLCAAG